MPAPGSLPTTRGSTSMVNVPPGALATPPETNQCRTRARVSPIVTFPVDTGSMNPRGVRAGGRRLAEDLQGLEHGELLSLDSDATVVEEERVLGELGAHLRDEKNRISVSRVAELHERALGPLAAVERERLAEHVEALRQELGQAVGPGEAPERDASAVEVPPVVDVVLGRDHHG